MHSPQCDLLSDRKGGSKPRRAQILARSLAATSMRRPSYLGVQSLSFPHFGISLSPWQNESAVQCQLTSLASRSQGLTRTKKLLRSLHLLGLLSSPQSNSFLLLERLKSVSEGRLHLAVLEFKIWGSSALARTWLHNNHQTLSAREGFSWQRMKNDHLLARGLHRDRLPSSWSPSQAREFTHGMFALRR